MITLYYNIHNNTILIPGIGTFANRALSASVVGVNINVINGGQVVYSGPYESFTSNGTITVNNGGQVVYSGPFDSFTTIEKVVITNAGQVIYSGPHSNLQNGGDLAGISGTPGTPVSFGADNAAVAAGVNAFVNHSEADWLSFLGLGV